MKTSFTVRDDRVLGECALGTLFEGRDESTRDPVTITLLNPDVSENPGFGRRFHREIARASLVLHPNVVRTYGSGVLKGRLFFATERVEGTVLGGLRAGTQRLAPDEILGVAEGSARALVAAEAHRIIPLHLRRPGIFITAEGAVKVAEFGLARILEKESDYQRLFPSSPYLSPERAQGSRGDVRSDIFSLGVILYELATGKPPFEGHQSKTSHLYQLLNVVPVFPRDAKTGISRELERIILRCLAKDPGRRYQSGSGVLEELLAVRRILAARPAAEDLVEDDSGDFDIDEDHVLGEGGMGTLFRGRQRSLNRVVAIKVIRDLLTTNADFRRRFRREAELLAQVRDGNVVQIFGAGTWKGRLFYAMELVEGQDLRARVAQGPALTLEEILHVGQGVGKALRAAWTRRIVHRDIKPSNILLAKDGTIKVTDFGLALSLVIRRADPKFIVGTRGYLSPEQGTGEDVDIRSDIYSLGVVLFELLTRRLPPGPLPSSSAVAGAVPPVDQEPWGDGGRTPGAVKAVVRKCLARDPERRFQNPDEFLTEILAVRQSLWALAHADSARVPKSRTWSEKTFPSLEGAYPSSVREMFELAAALGDHEVVVKLAESEFGRPSKEYHEACIRARAAAFEAARRAALQMFLAEDWKGAASAYRDLLEHADPGQAAALRLAVDYCERLTAARAAGRIPRRIPRLRMSDLEPNDSSIHPKRPLRPGPP
jgi:serine/threonine protein kinase